MKPIKKWLKQKRKALKKDVKHKRKQLKKVIKAKPLSTRITNNYNEIIDNIYKYENLDNLNNFLGDILKGMTIFGLPVYEYLVFSGQMLCKTPFEYMRVAILMPTVIWGIYKCMEKRYKNQNKSNEKASESQQNAIEQEVEEEIKQILQVSREKKNADATIQEKESLDFSQAFEEIPHQELGSTFIEEPSFDMTSAFTGELEQSDQNKPMTLGRKRK